MDAREFSKDTERLMNREGSSSTEQLTDVHFCERRSSPVFDHGQRVRDVVDIVLGTASRLRAAFLADIWPVAACLERVNADVVGNLVYCSLLHVARRESAEDDSGDAQPTEKGDDRALGSAGMRCRHAHKDTAASGASRKKMRECMKILDPPPAWRRGGYGKIGHLR